MASTETTEPSQVHATPQNVWFQAGTVWAVMAVVGAGVAKLAWDMATTMARIDSRMEHAETQRSEDREWIKEEFEEVKARLSALEHP